MAFEEDFNKRREQREKLRQQRLAEHRKLITKLIIAAVALVLCAVLILTVVLRADSGQPTEPPVTTTVPTDTQPPVESTADTTPSTEGTEPSVPDTTEPPTTGEALQTTTPTESEYTVIHITAAGDVNVNDTTVALDHAAAIRDLLPVLSGGDLTLVNFEGNLVGEPYGTQEASAPQSLMTALKNAGVDMIQMANSYSIYNGLSGLRTTLSAIEAAGMTPVGAWPTAQEASQSGGFTIREVNGIRVAVVAFTKGMSSMALPAGSESCVNVLYKDYATTYQKVDTAGITAIMKNVAAAQPDVTIALVHWGSEFKDEISGTQKQIRDLLLSQGADAIIGTHPHYVQALDYDAQEGTFVAYSLGDLLSDGRTAGTEYGIILDLEITKDLITGETKITGYDYIPVFNIHEEGKPLQVVRLHQAIAAYESGYLMSPGPDTYGDMLYALQRVEARVTPEKPKE